MQFDEILVPFDGSEGARHAATTGSQLASQLGLPLKLAYVVPMTAESTMALASLTKEEVQALHQNQADTVFSTAQESLGQAIAGADRVVRIGDAATEILDYLADNPAALVIMGRRGLSPIKTLLMGSVSDKVMRHGGSAVMVVG
ncbi:MAG: universal stress protein [Pseudomonadota bacterium]